jgi:hypothetical protein
MTAPTPLEKADELIDSINGVIAGHIGYDSLERISAEAEKLEQVNYVAAKRVMGMIAATRGNIEEMERQFAAAIKAGGIDPLTYSNYASALANVGNMLHAVRVSDEMVAQTPDDLSAIRQAISLHFDAYDVEGTRHLIKLLEKLDGSKEDIPTNQNMNEITEILNAAQTNWEEISERIRIATTAIAKQGKARRGQLIRLHSGRILYKFMFDENVEAIFKIESAMIDAISDEQFSPADRVIFFSCESV